MSLRARSKVDARHPGDAWAYRRSFIGHVYCLIAAGYRRLEHESLREEEEPAITGFLVEAIRQYCDEPQAPRWAQRYFIQEELSVNRSGVKGKSRPRVDIEIEGNHKTPRRHFQIEAKRLRESDSGSRSDYLGRDGLGCFLAGRYAEGHEDAGMLGYVQSGTPSSWASKIAAELGRDPDSYLLASGCSGLQPQRPVDGLDMVYCSSHQCFLRPLEVHHIFLLCW